MFSSLLLLFLGVVAVSAVERNFSVVTWNVNGVRKFEFLPNEIAFLRSHDVVLLQETFSREDVELLELSGFSSHHARALPGQSEDRRNIWGLSSFFRLSSSATGIGNSCFRRSIGCSARAGNRNQMPG
jgi:hypothetical protein